MTITYDVLRFNERTVLTLNFFRRAGKRSADAVDAVDDAVDDAVNEAGDDVGNTVMGVGVMVGDAMGDDGERDMCANGGIGGALCRGGDNGNGKGADTGGDDAIAAIQCRSGHVHVHVMMAMMRYDETSINDTRSELKESLISNNRISFVCAFRQKLHRSIDECAACNFLAGNCHCGGGGNNGDACAEAMSALPHHHNHIRYYYSTIRLLRGDDGDHERSRQRITNRWISECAHTRAHFPINTRCVCAIYA